jgi:hypothetical protein
MICNRTHTLLLTLLCCCLLAAGPALARQSGKPPVPGEQLEMLLGMHRDAQTVVDMLK